MNYDAIDHAKRYRKLADELQHLAELPDRLTKKDVEAAAKALRDAADDIDGLARAKPSGCICRHIEDDNYSYLHYDERCYHHGDLVRRTAAIKNDYEKAEKRLRDEVRMKLIVAALPGATALPDLNKEEAARVAIDAADAVIRQLLSESKDVTP